MVEVFKTDVREAEHAERLIDLLYKYFPARKINFDLEDCDKILRIDSTVNFSSEVIETLRENGVWSEQLP